MREDNLDGRLTLEVMGKIWNDDGNTFSDKQLMQLREFVYVLHRAIIGIYQRKKCSKEEC